ncbi:MAG TPA: ABC transporter permease [Patescibacteria group bacterium]|nr:ABC transporter permease [Patescibacteria group bacterium]
MPDWKQYVRKNLRASNLRPEREAEIVDDLAQQLEEAYGDALKRGLTESEAETVARQHISDWKALAHDLQNSPRLAVPLAQNLGNRLEDAAADGRRWAAWFAGVSHDLLYSVRLIRKNPGFTAIAVLTLALGIGANVTIFSWINAILLNPVPGASDPGRLVEVITLSKTESYTSMSYPDFKDFREQANLLDGIAVHEMRGAAINGPNGAERIWVELVSDNFFDVLGVRPILGRSFSIAEGRAAVPVVAISEGLWRNRLAADPDIIGKTIDLNRTSFTVIGVMPGEFLSGYTGLAMDVWAPVQMMETFIPGENTLDRRGAHWLNTLARLKPGVTPAQAAAQLSAIATQIERRENGSGEIRLGAFPLWRSPRGAQAILGPVLLVLMGVVGVILLITCANIANLLLSRAVVRRREFAVRLSIGCSRMRLLRQLVTETLVLVALSAAAALVAQRWTAGLLLLFIPPSDLPIALVTNLDLRILGFTAAVALASAVFFGILPAWQASRTDLVVTLKSDRIQGSVRQPWLRNAIVVSQLALSLPLLISASLFIRSLQNAELFDPGFRTDNMLLASVDLLSAGYDQARGSQTVDRILTEIRALPGVESASYARRVPLAIGGGSSSTSLDAEGFEPPKGSSAWSYLNWVGPGYFRTMGIPVVQGREFEVSDRPENPEGLVVNQTFAERYWPGEDPIGKRIRFSQAWYPVIGVVGDSKFRRLNEPFSPFVYLSTAWNYRPDVIFHIRVSSDPMSLARPVRAIVHQVDPELPVFDVVTLKENITAASFQQKLAASLLGVFGGMALLLASVGLYGTMAYSVARRTHEMGVRMALGASRRAISRLVVTNALRITAVGIVAGTALAVVATRLISKLLFGVQPTDPASFGGVILLMAVIAVVASVIPARRAARLDPMAALRDE